MVIVAKSIARNSLVTLIVRVATIFISAGTGILLSRSLGPEGKGTYSFAMLVASLCLSFFVNMSVAVSHRISHHSARPGQVLANALTVALAAGGALILGFCLAANWLAQRYGFDTAIYVGLGSPLILINTYLAAGMLGTNQIRGYNLADILPAMVGLSLNLIVLLGFRGGTHSVLIAWVISQALTTAYLLYMSRRFLWPLFWEIKLSEIWWLVSFGGQIGLINLISFLNYKVDAFLVQSYLGNAALGVYSIAISTAELLWFFPRSLSIASFARIGGESESGAAALTARNLRHTLLVTMVSGVGIAFVGPYLIPLVYGSGFRGAGAPLLALLPGVIAYGLSGVLAVFFTNQLGRPWIGAIMSTAGFAINVGVSLLLIPRMGMLGGAIATTVSYGVSVVFGLLVFLHLSGLPAQQLFPGRREVFDYVTLFGGLARRKGDVT